MPDFLLLFVGLTAQPEAADETTAAYNQKWGGYMGELAQRGALKSGTALAPSGVTVSRDGVEPLEVQTVDVGGYLLVEADSIDGAAEIAKGAPHIELGGTTIVRPCIDPGT